MNARLKFIVLSVCRRWFVTTQDCCMNVKFVYNLFTNTISNTRIKSYTRPRNIVLFPYRLHRSRPCGELMVDLRSVVFQTWIVSCGWLTRLMILKYIRCLTIAANGAICEGPWRLMTRLLDTRLELISSEWPGNVRCSLWRTHTEVRYSFQTVTSPLFALSP